MPSPADVVWDDWVLLAIQILTLLVLVVYVWKTWEMASATRKAAEAAEQTLNEARESRIEELAPAVLVYFDSSPWGGAEVVLENAGRGAAADVSLSFDPPLQSTQPHETDKFFDSTQSILPPGYRIAQIFDAWASLLESDLPKQYEVTVRYRGVQTGRSYEQRHDLNAEALRYRFIGRNKGINEVAEELEKARKAEEEHRRQFGRKQYENLFNGPVDVTLPQTGEQAVQFMLGHWRLQRELRQIPDTFVPGRPVVSSIRSDILNVFRFLPIADFSQDQVNALTQVAATVFNREAEAAGGGRSWMDKMETHMAAVEEQFADG